MQKTKLFDEAIKIIDAIYLDKSLSLEVRKVLYERYCQIIRKCAYRGIPEAQYEYGQLFEKTSWESPINPRYNPKRSFYWYTKACKNNIGISCNNLAFMYETGLGCNVDINKALELYKKASILGNDSGKKNYKKLKKDMEKKDIYNKNKS